MVSRPLPHPGIRTHLLAAVILFLWVPGPSLADESNPWWRDALFEDAKKTNSPVFMSACYLDRMPGMSPQVSIIVFPLGQKRGIYYQIERADTGVDAGMENSGIVESRKGIFVPQIAVGGFAVQAAERDMIRFLMKAKFQIILPSQFAKWDPYKDVKQLCAD